MQQNLRQKQLLTFFSLLILLVLPTAIVGYTNFSSFFSQAFGKPFQKNESAYIVSHVSSENISKGGNFSIKIDAATPKALPYRHFAAFVEFDRSRVSVSSVITQNLTQFSVIEFQNGFLIYPKASAKPSEYSQLLPPKCEEEGYCVLDEAISSNISFSINGTLITELTEQQRPIKVSIIGISEGTSTYIWNEKVYLPSLKLGNAIKNESPVFTSEPLIYAKSTEDYIYDISATDADNDPIVFSLTCPEAVFCENQGGIPTGLTIESNRIIWKAPKPQAEPYIITVYANDGKSISAQTFAVKVLDSNETYFTCSFTPAVSVKILDYRKVAPMVIIANSSEPLAAAEVTLYRGSKAEKTFNYTFTETPTSVIVDQNSNPPLAYQFSEGEYTGQATFTTVTGGEFVCELENPVTSLLTTIKNAVSASLRTVVDTVYAAINVGTNHAPTFSSDPMLPASSGGSSPAVSFVYGTAYSFTLRAQDVDGDPLQYKTVTKPDWAQIAVTQTAVPGNNSTMAIQITGTPVLKDAGSNLFSFSINDGLGNYITRTWVINVDYPDNDIPRVTIFEPNGPITRTQGQTFTLKWDVEDRNQVVSFALYYTKSLAPGDARTTLIPTIDYKMRGMSISTANIPPGDYYFILAAKDSHNPPATGIQYTAMVRIVAKPIVTTTPQPTTTATPTVTSTATATPTSSVTQTPTVTPTEIVPEVNELMIQVTNPQNQATIAPTDFQLVASFTASKDAEIEKKDIVIKLDGADITDKITIQPDKGNVLTAAYKPATLLNKGVHQLEVFAVDSAKKDKTVKISFTIQDVAETEVETITIFGFDIKKADFIIYAAVLILILLGLLLPVIMYFAYRKSDSDQQYRKPIVPQQPIVPPQLRTQTASFATGTRQNIPLTPASTVPVQFQPQRPVVQQMAQPVAVPVSAPVQQPISQPVQPVQPVMNTQPPQMPQKQSPTISGPQQSTQQAMAAFMAQTSGNSPKPVNTSASAPVQVQRPPAQPVPMKPATPPTPVQPAKLPVIQQPVKQTPKQQPPPVVPQQRPPQTQPQAVNKPQMQQQAPANQPRPVAPPTVPGKSTAQNVPDIPAESPALPK